MNRNEYSFSPRSLYSHLKLDNNKVMHKPQEEEIMIVMHGADGI